MKFKVKDKVRIRRDSQYSDQNSGIGEIKNIDDLWLIVKFADDYSNSYHENDLILASSKEKTKKTIIKSMTILAGTKKYTSELKKHINQDIKSNASVYRSYCEEIAGLFKVKNPEPEVERRLNLLEDRKERTKKSTRDLKKQEKKLKRSVNSIVKNFTKLKKHPLIVGVEATKDSFKIYTKPLKVEGEYIGNYEILLSYNPGYGVEIRNLTGQVGGHLDHWFVDNGNPCFSRWGNGIRNYLKTGEIYLAIDNILCFLRSTYRSEEGFRSFEDWISEF